MCVILCDTALLLLMLTSGGLFVSWWCPRYCKVLLSQAIISIVIYIGVSKEKPIMLSVEVQTQTCDFIDLTSSSPREHEKSRKNRKEKRYLSLIPLIHFFVIGPFFKFVYHLKITFLTFKWRFWFYFFKLKLLIKS